jgi:predicted RNase H-like HicB family nuclease
MSQAFAVVIEETDHNFLAYVPDLPGCVATGPTRDDVLAEIPDAIAFHLEGLAADAQPPAPCALQRGHCAGVALALPGTSIVMPA